MNTDTKTKSLPLLWSLCLCLAAASVSAAPFTSSHGYSLTLPPGWQINPGYNIGADAVFISGADAIFVYGHPSVATSKFAPIMVIHTVPSPQGLTIAAMRSRLAADLRKNTPHAVVLSLKASSLGGAPDTEVVFVSMQNGKPSRTRQVCVLRNHSVYILTADYPEKTHALYDASVSQMLASFHWKS